MDQGGQAPVLVGGQPDVVPGRGAVGGDGEALSPGGDQLHRPVHPLGRQRDEGRALGQRAARAEGPADVGRHHMHVVGRDAELLGHAVLGAPDVLAGFPHGQLAARPGADGGEELDGIVVLGRGRIAAVDLHGPCREGGLRVADLGVLMALGDGLGRDGVGARAVEIGRGPLFGVGDLEPAGRFVGGLGGVGDDHGHDLAGVPDPGGLQRTDGRAHIALVGEGLAGFDRGADVLEGQDLQHPRHGASGGLVDGDDPAAGDRAGRQGRMGRPVGREVRAVLRLAPHLQRAIDPWNGDADAGLDAGFAVSHLRPPSSRPAARRASGCAGRALA